MYVAAALERLCERILDVASKDKGKEAITVTDVERAILEKNLSKLLSKVLSTPDTNVNKVNLIPHILKVAKQKDLNLTGESARWMASNTLRNWIPVLGKEAIAAAERYGKSKYGKPEMEEALVLLKFKDALPDVLERAEFALNVYNKEKGGKDPCEGEPNPCQNDGICIREGEAYSCECIGNYSGDNCEDGGVICETLCDCCVLSGGYCVVDSQLDFIDCTTTACDPSKDFFAPCEYPEVCTQVSTNKISCENPCDNYECPGNPPLPCVVSRIYGTPFCEGGNCDGDCRI